MADLPSYVDGLLHEPTQVHDGVVDLTAGDVYEIAKPGRVDFGGDERAPAELVAVPTTRRFVSDDYEWWDLEPGTYVLELNETLSPPEGGRLELQPHGALVDGGAFHPTMAVADLAYLPLLVGGAGIRIKENARVTTVVGLRA